MKKAFLTLLTFCALTAAAQNEIIVGDMNDDGLLSVGDVTALTDAIVHPERQRSISLKCDPNVSDPAAIAGSWSTADGTMFTFTADGVAISRADATVKTFEYYPYRGDIVLFNASGEVVKCLHVARLADDSLVLSNADGSCTTYYPGDPLSNPEPVSYTVNGVTFNMKLVEHGTFQMGTANGPTIEKPAHSVTISKDYYIGETEVTQALWYAVMGQKGQKPTSDGQQWNTNYGLGDDYPAYFISWNDCQEFITKLNELTGQTFRMPTEAEWEYAAKGAGKSLGYTYSGSNTVDDVAWCTGYNLNMHPVATKKPNELGIYDMSGNVWEWCSDWYGSYSSDAVTDPVGATSGTNHVKRGGAYNSEPSYCRSAYRSYNNPLYCNYDLGLRLALSPSK